MIRILAPLFTLLLLSSVATAQQRLPGNQNIYGAAGRGVIYDKELTFNLALLAPRNVEFSVRSGKLVSFDKMKYWSLGLGNIRHSRERKINPEDFNPNTKRISRSYTYGKENQLYALRFAFGTRKYLSEKARNRGVAVGYSYEFGPTLGILKPYFLEAKLSDGQFSTVDIRHTGENTERFLNQDVIFGGSSWATGLDEIGLRPGVHARAAAHFAFGAYDEVPKYLEAGLLADFFIGETDLMIESDLTPGVTNSPLYLSLYVKLSFGKRW
ncbi:hypothetical protein [Neolewinella antarctica]|uniref:Outer membrane protein beta-barrel domain-containing protein n=1 Tax=Neolewinella antarctica TaxID=442734 RepID=A0ABX0X5V7_9BACT|nr:hypothetical protein [Neolewinella antarctica]NJC24580.1 hypothetical protein [Neolewinella antarctica]